MTSPRGLAARLLAAQLLAIGAGAVTFDLARPMVQEGRSDVREVGTFEFAMEIIKRMS
jgi:hypothetical protein